MFRILALAVGLLAVAPLAASAQQSATPLLDTGIQNGAPVIPFGGFKGPQNTIADKAAINNTSEVLGMLNAGNSPNDQDDSGRTGLHYAAMNGNPLLAQILLQRGARTDIRDKFGNTPLHWAADRGANDVARQLIEAKAQVDAQNKQGITPLMMAAGRARTDMVRLLLSAKADPKAQDYTGRDAVGWAANRNVAQLLTAR